MDKKEAIINVGEVRDDEKMEVNKVVHFSDTEMATIRRGIRKADWRVLPIMYLLFLSNSMDRNNIGTAMINGMVQKLNLSPTDQGNVAALLLISYIVVEPFSNVLLKRTRPSIWFPILSIGWAIACMCLAAATNATQAIIIRLIIGGFEAGFAPGVITYMAYWYTREEVGPRMSVMFTALPISGIVNLLYGALVLIKINNLMPYQPIFIFGGLITLLVGIASIFIIQDYPEQVKFLTEEERALIVKRLNASQGSAAKSRISIKSIIETLLDWRVWAFALLNMSRNNALTIIGYSGPSIIRALKYSSSTSTFLTAVASVTGAIGTAVFAFFFKKTSYWIRILVLDLFTVICLLIVAYATNDKLRLAFLLICGFPIYAVYPITMSWMSVNAGSTQKRALSSAAYMMVGSAAAMATPYLFTTKTAPKFTIGYVYGFTLYGISFIVVSLLTVSFKHANKHRDSNPKDVSHLSPEEQRAMHDFHPDFRYMI
ncbi:putative tartrate transporter [Zancudomyces culisetae]|uniref:Putative tartrate transporter n=1 Tax=Zancudomyces culisetae TaxID=1213189 RepID=A0A1R1PRQ8_ZANCU|nr:putative tartrate transporter [Zancudomyces culisetae]|eukprot:OMH83572.1 putative tartrate transporter [Zancudomyces culisetae]